MGRLGVVEPEACQGLARCDLALDGELIDRNLLEWNLLEVSANGLSRAKDDRL